MISMLPRFLEHSRLSYLQEILLIAALVVVSTCFVLLFKRRHAKHLLRNFPTVVWNPKFISYRYGDDGKLPSSTITNILPRMAKLNGPYGCYGTVYGISTPVIHIAHPTPAQAVLQDAGQTQDLSTLKRRSSLSQISGASKAPAYDHFKNFSGHGVFSADGEEWRTKRTSVLHCLLRQGDRVETEGYSQAQALTDCLSLLAKGDQPVNVVPILQRTTLSLIYRYLTLTEPDSGVETYLDAVIRIRMILLAQSRSIWSLFPRWCYVLFSSMHRHEEEVMKPIRGFASRALAAAKQGSPLAELQRKTSSHTTPQALLDEAITLLFAGQDTGAATLSWTLHLLSLHPEVQQKLSDEVTGATDFTRVPYLDAVIKESMRLFPVAPFVVRRIMHDIRTPEVTLPRGALACIWVYGMHRNPAIWEIDSDSFVPQRWIEGPAKLELDSFMPFCVGPRNCLGQPLAHVWLRILLGRLIQSFEFIDDRLRDGIGAKDLYLDMQAGFTILPLGGVKLRVVPRQKHN